MHIVRFLVPTYARSPEPPARVSRSEPLTAAVLVADVGEAPDVAEVDGEPDDGQQELHLLVPGLALSAGLGLLQTGGGRLRLGGGGQPGRRRRLCVPRPGQRGPRHEPGPGAGPGRHGEQGSRQRAAPALRGNAARTDIAAREVREVTGQQPSDRGSTDVAGVTSPRSSQWSMVDSSQWSLQP